MRTLVCVYNFQKIIFLWVWEQYINLKKDQASQVKTETLSPRPKPDPKILLTHPKPFRFGLGRESFMLNPNLNGLFMICDTLVGKLNVVKFVVSVTLLIQ